MTKKRVLFASCAAIGLFIFFSQIFTVYHTTCYLEEEACPEELAASVTQSLVGESLIFSDLQQIALKKQVGIGYTLTTVKKVLPGKLVVYFSQSPPLYLIKTPESTFGVDSQGYLQSIGESTGVVTVQFAQEPVLLEQKKLDQNTHQIIVMSIKTLEKAQTSLESIIWKSNQEIDIKLEKVTLVIDESTAETALPKALGVLQSKEFQETTKDTNATFVLDMRFRLPVLRTL